MSKNNMFINENIADGSIIVYLELNCAPEATCKLKVQLVVVILVSHYWILFFEMAFAMSAHCTEDSACTLSSDTWRVKFRRMDCMSTSAWELEVTLDNEMRTASEISINLSTRTYLYLGKGG